jgi:hypothetical protein
MGAGSVKRGFEMSSKRNALSAVTVILLAASPCLAMSTVTVPTNSNGTPRFTDTTDQAPSKFSMSVHTTTSTSGNGLGYGSGFTFGNRAPGADGPAADLSPTTNPGYSSTVPTVSNYTDPTFGPNGIYTPGLHDSRK